jgi:serine O-acetyltransferase
VRPGSRPNEPVPTCRALIISDLRAEPVTRPPRPVHQDRHYENPGVVASSILRAQQTLNGRGWHRTAGTLRHATLALSGLDFVPGAEVGPGLLMHHPHGIVVGCGTVVGAGCPLLQNVTLGTGERFADGRPPHDYPQVGDGVTIGAGACVLGRVHVGDRAVIGANSVVLSDVPVAGVAVGSPARVLNTESESPLG